MNNQMNGQAYRLIVVLCVIIDNARRGRQGYVYQVCMWNPTVYHYMQIVITRVVFLLCLLGIL